MFALVITYAGDFIGRARAQKRILYLVGRRRFSQTQSSRIGQNLRPSFAFFEYQEGVIVDKIPNRWRYQHGAKSWLFVLCKI